MSAIQAVVFDIGNVLIRWDPQGFYDARIGLAARQALFAAVPLEAANLAIDHGAPFYATIADLAAEHPAYADQIMLWHDEWLTMASPAIEASVQLMQGLQAQGVACWALSNFGEDTFEIAQQAYPFLDDFDGRVISGYLGVAKPDPAIYEALEEAAGLRGPALFFTDDRPENIAAAAARGWCTHLFHTPQGLADALQGHGLRIKGHSA